MASPHVVEVSNASFAREVIERSRSVPVLVDFWAPWCGPCRTLTPVLEGLAAQYGGRFQLAKVNSDDNQALAAEWGVRSIPTVMAFADGALVDQFSGALPEGTLRQFIEALLPSPATGLLREASARRAQGDLAGALALLEQAAGLDPASADAALERAAVLLELGRVDEAGGLLAALPAAAREDPRCAALEARLQFAAEAGADPVPLEQRLRQNPDDLEARLALARLEVGRRRYREGLEQLLEIVRRDRAFGDDAGRKAMLSVFQLLGPDHELTREYRRLLAGALY